MDCYHHRYLCLDVEAPPCLPNVDSTYGPIVKLGHPLLLHHQHNFFHQLPEAVIRAASAGVIGPLAVDGKNCADGAEAKDAPILLSVRTSNLRSEDMVEIQRQGIDIDDDNNPSPYTVPRQGKTTTVTVNCRREGIISPRKAGNLQNYFASFRHYSHDDNLCMSLLQLFLIMFPGDYLEEVLISETNKVLSVPMDLQEYIQWVGCWLYMAC